MIDVLYCGFIEDSALIDPRGNQSKYITDWIDILKGDEGELVISQSSKLPDITERWNLPVWAQKRFDINHYKLESWLEINKKILDHSKNVIYVNQDIFPFICEYIFKEKKKETATKEDVRHALKQYKEFEYVLEHLKDYRKGDLEINQTTDATEYITNFQEIVQWASKMYTSNPEVRLLAQNRNQKEQC